MKIHRKPWRIAAAAATCATALAAMVLASAAQATIVPQKKMSGAILQTQQGGTTATILGDSSEFVATFQEEGTFKEGFTVSSITVIGATASALDPVSITADVHSAIPRSTTGSSALGISTMAAAYSARQPFGGTGMESAQPFTGLVAQGGAAIPGDLAAGAVHRAVLRFHPSAEGTRVAA